MRIILKNPKISEKSSLMKKIIFYCKWAYFKLIQYYKLGILCFFMRDALRRLVSKLTRRFPVLNQIRFNNARKNSIIRPRSLYKFENHIYSQNGEDGIILHILSIIPHKKYFVEFGVEDATECNCRILRENGYAGIMMDLNGDGEKAYREYISRENINSLFKKYNVPYDAGILSIDIDGNDFWIWKSLSSDYKFDLVIIEYNSSLGYKEAKVMPYRNDYKWDGTDYFGASIKTLEKLGNEKGYILVYADMTGTNLCFLNNKHRELLDHKLSVKNTYQAPYYGRTNTGHPHDPLKREYLTY